jgi:hypothetical protein
VDILKSDQEIIKQVIRHYAQFKPSHGNIRLDTVFDDTQGRYALMQVGWDRADSHSRGRRVRGNLIYITLRDHKIWIEYDGMEQGITDDLIAAGIAQERIVLAFLPDIQSAVVV